MKSLHSRVKHAVLPLVAVLVLSACGVEERDQLKGELAETKRERDALAARATTAESEAKTARGQLLDYRRRAEDAERAAAERETCASIAESTAKTAESEARRTREELEKWMRANPEDRRKEYERVVGHRDELKEWIDQELLPVAEKQDARLVNLKDAAADMAAEVEKVRGLKFKTPFMRRLITRTQVGDWMRRDMKKDMSEDEVRKMVVVGEEFGLLAPKTDVYAVFAQFMEGGAAAFYKPDTQTFYHIEGNDGRGARPVVFHELVHAVEDQYFHLDDFYKAVDKDNDMALARRGLVEGSACHFAEKYEKTHPDDVRAMMKAQATPDMMQKQMKMMQVVPPVLVLSMGLYPYKNAPDWLAKIGADDAGAIEKLYADPPVSTEQVLHPSKFPLNGPRDYPHKIATPDVAKVLGDGWENIDDNDMGELTIGLLLTQLQNGGKYMPTLIGSLDLATQGVGFKGAPKKASEGWDGDRYTAWSEKATGKCVVAWATVWDSDQDAKEFYETYGDLLGKRVLGKAWTSRPTPARFVNPETGRVSGLDITRNRVFVVLDAPADKADALFAACAATKIEADPRDAADVASGE